ncbi:hypothetical protein CBR_g31384 [Chara braunii]|uniref:U3 small nucleolar RNA-associated protein 6 homolog n=1 Tax=Chara braunii TaxID=69332 RepID=A0A388LEU8_CHABU|nr:hypothetical protein CBR_g31384 [Chara braunii]|eukprot:GBG80828.1 hypothetical protein CBR_g31384 [Chara braunii]
MLPGLEDLENRGLFSREEIKQIIKKRQDFEYLLKRRSRVKEDFLRYLAYETQLESLRALRKRAILRNMKAKKIQWKRSCADGAIVNQLVLIYDRAVTKFKGDLRLWMMYLEFCREQNLRRQLRKVLARALQYHPTVPGLWMYAASYEFTMQKNMLSARAQMQRGLRMCPKSESMWIEYFKMELTYLAKLQARREVLGIGPLPKIARITTTDKDGARGYGGDGGEDVVMGDQEDDEDEGGGGGGRREESEKGGGMNGGGKKPTAIASGVGNRVGENDGDDDDEEEKEEEEEEEEEEEGGDEGAKNAKGRVVSGHQQGGPSGRVGGKDKDDEGEGQTGKQEEEGSDISTRLAKIIYGNAIAAIPDSLNFRRKFLEVVALMPFDGKEEVEEDIYASLAKDFRKKEESWDCRARRWVSRQGMGSRVAIEKAIQRYACFLEAAFNCTVEAVGRSQTSLREAEDMATLLLSLCERAEAAGASSHLMFTRHVRVLLNSGRDADALAVAARACEDESLNKSGNVWVVRLDLEMLHHNSLAMKNTDTDEDVAAAAALADDDDNHGWEGVEHYRQRMEALLEQALSVVPLSEAKPLWGKAICFFRESKASWDRLMKMAEKALALGCGTSGRSGPEVAIMLIDSSMDIGGVQDARKTYNRLLALPGAGLALFRHCIDMETYGDWAGEVNAASHIDRLFDMASSLYGEHDADIWLDYCKHKMKVGDAAGAARVHWKAKKMLKDPREFLEGYHRLQC